jgi:hypothetical protein
LGPHGSCSDRIFTKYVHGLISIIIHHVHEDRLKISLCIVLSWAMIIILNNVVIIDIFNFDECL